MRDYFDNDLIKLMYLLPMKMILKIKNKNSLLLNQTITGTAFCGLAVITC